MEVEEEAINRNKVTSMNITRNEEDVDFNDYHYAPAVRFGIDNGAEFRIFSLSVHHHAFDDVRCSVRFAVELTIMGITVEIALMRAYKMR